MDEITAEYAVAELAPAEALRVRTRVAVGARTDLGRVRENNEDKFEFFLPDDDRTLASRGLVFLVCDGMGGHAAGQIASELAAKTFLDVYLEHPGADPAEAMRAGVAAANRFVVSVGAAVPARRGMGTTLTGLVLIQDSGWLVHAGDSRLYRLREGELLQISHDHTVMEEMVRSGVLTREQAQSHPQKHAILRAIGLPEGVEPQIERFELRAGDAFLLCSDGVTNHVPDEALLRLLSLHGPSEAARRAVGEALLGGGSDNATCLVVRVEGLDPIAGAAPEAAADSVG